MAFLLQSIGGVPIERAIVRPFKRGNIATKINKTIIYLVRYRKGEVRLYFIGRIEDALLTIEAQSLW